MDPPPPPIITDASVPLATPPSGPPLAETKLEPETENHALSENAEKQADSTEPPEQAAAPEPAAKPTAASRKRKRAQAAAPANSPAPGESSESNTDLLTGKQDLFSRPVITISRLPIFAPFPTTSNPNLIFHTTEQLPNNRVGFFYSPAGIKPSASTCVVPCRTIESDPPSYRASWEDRSPFLKISKDGLSLLGDKGFRTARCNAPMREGKWYIEVKVTRGGGEPAPETTGKLDGSHVRLGWCRREASINGPVGVDGYSYGIRDKTGEKVTLSRPTPYGKSFGSGDVIGMYISLPPRRQADPNDAFDPARLHRQRIAIEFKGQEYFESLEYPVAKEMSSLMTQAAPSTAGLSVPSNSSKKSATVKNVPERPRAKVVQEKAPPQARSLPTLPSSRIAFFLNGESQGVAFQDLYDYLQLRKEPVQKAKEKKKRDGAREHRENPFDDGYLGYYPSISLFNFASVQINPGPNFDFPPPADIDALLDDTTPSETQTWRPACERYSEFMDEQWALDVLEEEEARRELAKREEQQQAVPKKTARPRKRQTAQEPKKRATKKSGVAAVFDRRTPGSEDQKHSQPGSVQPSPLRFGYTASTEDVNMDPAEAVKNPSVVYSTAAPMERSESNTSSVAVDTKPTISSPNVPGDIIMADQLPTPAVQATAPSTLEATGPESAG